MIFFGLLIALAFGWLVIQIGIASAGDAALRAGISAGDAALRAEIGAGDTALRSEMTEIRRQLSAQFYWTLTLLLGSILIPFLREVTR